MNHSSACNRVDVPIPQVSTSTQYSIANNCNAVIQHLHNNLHTNYVITIVHHYIFSNYYWFKLITSPRISNFMSNTFSVPWPVIMGNNQKQNFCDKISHLIWTQINENGNSVKMKSVHVSLHFFSGMNLVSAYKQHNVLRNGETVSKTVHKFPFPKCFLIVLSHH